VAPANASVTTTDNSLACWRAAEASSVLMVNEPRAASIAARTVEAHQNILGPLPLGGVSVMCEDILQFAKHAAHGFRSFGGEKDEKRGRWQESFFSPFHLPSFDTLFLFFSFFYLKKSSVSCKAPVFRPSPVPYVCAVTLSGCSRCPFYM
jgi:hypothetical protein